MKKRLLPLVAILMAGCTAQVIEPTAPAVVQASAAPQVEAASPSPSPIAAPPSASPSPMVATLPAPATVGRTGVKGYNYFTFSYPTTWHLIENDGRIKGAVVVAESKDGKGLVYVQESDAEDLEPQTYLDIERATAGQAIAGDAPVSIGGADSYIVASKQQLAGHDVTMMASGVVIIPGQYPSIKAKVYRIVFLVEDGAPESVKSEYAYILSSWKWMDISRAQPGGGFTGPSTTQGGSGSLSGPSCASIQAQLDAAERLAIEDLAARGMSGSGQEAGVHAAFQSQRASALAGCR